MAEPPIGSAYRPRRGSSAVAPWSIVARSSDASRVTPEFAEGSLYSGVGVVEKSRSSALGARSRRSNARIPGAMRTNSWPRDPTMPQPPLRCPFGCRGHRARFDPSCHASPPEMASWSEWYERPLTLVRGMKSPCGKVQRNAACKAGVTASGSSRPTVDLRGRPRLGCGGGSVELNRPHRAFAGTDPSNRRHRWFLQYDDADSAGPSILRLGELNQVLTVTLNDHPHPC